MKMSIYRLMLNAGTVAGILLVAGCIGDGSKSDNSIDSSKTTPKVIAESLKPAPQTKNIVLLGDQRDFLRVSIVADSAEPDEKAFGGDIALHLKGALATEGVKIVTGDKFDIRIIINPKLTVVDKDGDYIRMNCEVAVEMKSTAGKRIYGAKKIEIPSTQRVLGKQIAISKLGTAAADETAEWCGKELKRIANAEIGVILLSIQLSPPLKGKKRDSADDANSLKEIDDKLAKMQHLLGYEFVGFDQQTGACQYRVAYFISDYPNGISNEVSALLK